MKAILFIIVIIGGLFFCSDTKWSGSVYRAEDNFFIIQFPKAKWQAKPWFYMKCIQGQKCRYQRESGDFHEEVAMVGDSYTGNGPGADRKDPSTEDEDQIKNAANYDDAHQAENNRQ